MTSLLSSPLYARKSQRRKGTFREEDHPRTEDGKFGSGGGGSSETEKPIKLQTGWKTVDSKRRGQDGFDSVEVGINQSLEKIKRSIEVEPTSRGFGKGLLTPEGDLYTWAESDSEATHHGGVANGLGLKPEKYGEGGYDRVYLYNDPNGELQVYAESSKAVAALSKLFPDNPVAYLHAATQPPSGKHFAGSWFLVVKGSSGWKPSEGRPPVVTVDLDGTLAEDAGSGTPLAEREPKEGAAEGVARMRSAGIWVIVWTANDEGEDKVREWLERWDIGYDDINNNKWVEDPDATRKIRSDAYLDDKAIPTTGKDWDELAQEAIIEVLGKARQPIDDEDGYDELAELAEEAYPELEELLDNLGFRTVRIEGLELGEFEHELFKSGGVVVIAPMKEHKRAKEKVEADYGGNWRKLLDIVRAAVAVDTQDDVRDALATIRGNGGIYARPPKDRFKEPLANGYRDYLVNYRLPSGVICEVQFHLKPMLIAREREKVSYDVARAIKASMEEEGREDYTPAESEAIRRARKASEHIFARAWEECQAKEGKEKSWRGSWIVKRLIKVVTETSSKDNAGVMASQGIRPGLKPRLAGTEIDEYAPGRGIEGDATYVKDPEMDKGGYGRIRLLLDVPEEQLDLPQELTQLGWQRDDPVSGLNRALSSPDGAVIRGELPASAVRSVEVYDNGNWKAMSPSDYLKNQLGIEGDIPRLPSQQEMRDVLTRNADKLHLSERHIDEQIGSYLRSSLADKIYLAQNLNEIEPQGQSHDKPQEQGISGGGSCEQGQTAAQTECTPAGKSWRGFALKGSPLAVRKYITHDGDEWTVRAESGRVLGTHDTRADAVAQLAAVEANKEKDETVMDVAPEYALDPDIRDRLKSSPLYIRKDVVQFYESVSTMSPEQFDYGLARVRSELSSMPKDKVQQVWQVMGMVGPGSRDKIVAMIIDRRGSWLRAHAGVLHTDNPRGKSLKSSPLYIRKEPLEHRR